MGAFYVGTFLITLLIAKKEETAEGYIVSNHNVGFGISAASMTATWIWAASFYGAATSAYNYGLSGAMHYGFWGALMILFIYPFGMRIRAIAPNARTLAEVIHARHGASSQMMLAISNLMGSICSLMINFTAAGALVSVLSPLSFSTGVLIAGFGTLLYTLWSGFRASVLTDMVQVMGMIAITVIVIPTVYFAAGGEEAMLAGLQTVTAEQQEFFSTKAILEQGAPFFIAVLAYAIGNQTIAQRLFAVRQDLIKPTFITATLGYGAVVIGLGMLGMFALFLGMQPVNGDMNTIIPLISSKYLSPFMLGLLFLLVIGSLSSTADSDLSALASITMADIYAKHFAKSGLNLKTMLLVGRLTMVGATALGLYLATSGSNDILSLLVFVGALWGAVVFPVIVSFYWGKVTNAAFTVSVAVAVILFFYVRSLDSISGAIALPVELISAVGAGVVIGLMVFAFLGQKLGFIGGIIVAAICVYYFPGWLRDYATLTTSLLPYGVSAIICYVMSVGNKNEFDISTLNAKVKKLADEAK
ncbi:MAG: sodium:solute symporter family transporter [Alphaproteobacteria bacterium]